MAFRYVATPVAGVRCLERTATMFPECVTHDLEMVPSVDPGIWRISWRLVMKVSSRYRRRELAERKRFLGH